MAVSRPAIERAGLLDEDLFAYVEDVDWSLRIRAAGLECVFVPSARAVHRVSASTGGAGSTHTVYYGTRNTIVVCERHRPLGAFGTAVRRASIVAAFLAHAGWCAALAGSGRRGQGGLPRRAGRAAGRANALVPAPAAAPAYAPRSTTNAKPTRNHSSPSTWRPESHIQT